MSMVRPSEQDIEESRLNWKLKVSNTADNPGITDTDTRYRQMQELNSLSYRIYSP